MNFSTNSRKKEPGRDECHGRVHLLETRGWISRRICRA
jgi:hypothetical protein